jgi:hypothetical protein
VADGKRLAPMKGMENHSFEEMRKKQRQTQIIEGVILTVFFIAIIVCGAVLMNTVLISVK